MSRTTHLNYGERMQHANVRQRTAGPGKSAKLIDDV